MRIYIEWIFPFLDKDLYLLWASVCREWKEYLKARKYQQVTKPARLCLSKAQLLWLRSEARLEDEWMILSAFAWRGDVGGLKREWHEIHSPYRLFLPAIGGGHLPMIEWLQGIMIAHQDGGLLSYEADKICGLAARMGHVHVLNWMFDKRYWFISGSVLSMAALKGHIKVLEWAFRRQNKTIIQCLYGSDIMHRAAVGNQRDFITWALEVGFGLERAAHGALLGGHADLFMWLVEKGAIVDEDAIRLLSGYSSSKLLDWAIARAPTSVDINALMCVTHRGWVGALNILFANHTAIFEARSKLLMSTACDGLKPRETLEWFLDRGFEWNDDVTKCLISRGNVEWLEWAYPRGLVLTEECVDYAMKKAPIKAAQWCVDKWNFNKT